MFIQRIKKWKYIWNVYVGEIEVLGIMLNSSRWRLWKIGLYKMTSSFYYANIGSWHIIELKGFSCFTLLHMLFRDITNIWEKNEGWIINPQHCRHCWISTLKNLRQEIGINAFNQSQVVYSCSKICKAIIFLLEQHTKYFIKDAYLSSIWLFVLLTLGPGRPWRPYSWNF